MAARTPRAGGGLALEPAAALRSCLGGAAGGAAAAARADVLLAALAAGGAPSAGFGSLVRSLLEPGDAAQRMANGDAAPAACAGDAAAEGFGDAAAEGFQRAAAPFPTHRRLELAALAVARLNLTLDAPSATSPAQQARAADLGAKAPSGGAAGAKGAPASAGAAAWRSEALDRAAAALASGALLRTEPAPQQVRARWARATCTREWFSVGCARASARTPQAGSHAPVARRCCGFAPFSKEDLMRCGRCLPAACAQLLQQGPGACRRARRCWGCCCAARAGRPCCRTMRWPP